jgi:hypothetical protein
MSARLIQRACRVLKPHPGGKAVVCFWADSAWPDRCLKRGCFWAAFHRLPSDSPMRRNRALTVKLKRA